MTWVISLEKGRSVRMHNIVSGTSSCRKSKNIIEISLRHIRGPLLFRNGVSQLCEERLHSHIIRHCSRSLRNLSNAEQSQSLRTRTSGHFKDALCPQYLINHNHPAKSGILACTSSNTIQLVLVQFGIKTVYPTYPILTHPFS